MTVSDVTPVEVSALLLPNLPDGNLSINLQNIVRAAESLAHDSYFLYHIRKECVCILTH